MVTFSETEYFILLQAIISLSFISLIMTFLWYRLHKKLKTFNKTDDLHVEEDISDSTLEHYLTTEIKLTVSRNEQLFINNNNRESPEITESDLLNLRVQYLELEKSLLSSKERGDYFWVNLAKILKDTLSSCYLVKRQKLIQQEEEEEEIKLVKEIMEEQKAEFNNIITELETEKKEHELDTLKEKLLKLSHSHTELSHCIFVLEDENMFLRDQIKSLLE